MRNSHKTIELLSVVFFSLLVFGIFVFFVLVPEGKEYRNLEIQVQEIDAEVSRLQMRYDSYYDRHRRLQEEHQAVVEALENSFDKETLMEMLKRDVTALDLDVQERFDDSRGMYMRKAEVKARFKSPKNFYRLIEVINSSEWIMSVKKPIIFERVGDEINATFGIEIYHSPV
ncbi:MAG: hypothetical protein B5M52_02735 [Helicobacteraceae bacterium 4484_230]|nr:MAG: hypothetical protein B5M52_02735 [Helicobacteraceae bacterium 4484_230]